MAAKTKVAVGQGQFGSQTQEIHPGTKHLDVPMKFLPAWEYSHHLPTLHEKLCDAARGKGEAESA
jgi:hypothetical protein